MRAFANGIGISYVATGAGEPVTLIHALGLDHTMWDPQVPALARQFRAIRYDVRGHGRSEHPPGPYSLELFAEDLHGLLQAIGLESSHVIGISMGGMIAQTFALMFPDEVRSIVLAGTASEHSVEVRRAFEQRARTAEERGIDPLADAAIARWFTAATRRGQPELVNNIAGLLRRTDPRTYAASCRAVADLDLTERLQESRAPALILAGAEDPVTTVDTAWLMHEHLPGSELQVIPNASHLSNLEQPDVFNRLVIDFLTRMSQQGGGPEVSPRD
ncbi:MAG: alpha/beta fold hydrolase [Chloroflexi bacterium]|nr:alpha/beta fold hydrolase [Chloroflexota bacterium]